MSSPESGAPGRPRRFRRATRIAAVVVALVLVVTGVSAYAVYRHLDGNIVAKDITRQLGTHRPPKVEKVGVPQQPLNIVIIGSDTRQGQGNHIGGDTPGLSDTTILLHLSADRKRAYGISIPRDSMVRRPSCQIKDGSTGAPALSQFNEAYALGGAGCTVKTIESLTHIHTDHYVVVDFNGFKKMVDALGGVQVCVPETVDDPQSDIHFSPGTYDVTGKQALAYVRERHAVGDGSDIGRIKRQQAFIASMSNKALSAGMLVHPLSLLGFLDAATKSLQTDPDLAHVAKLAGLAKQFKDIGLDHIQFLTVPIEAYPPDPNRLQWSEPQARRLWQRVNQDLPLTKRQSRDVTTAKSPTHATPNGSHPSKTQTEQAAAAAAQNGLCS
jgi:LCP family protein required for cell wall assembly